MIDGISGKPFVRPYIDATTDAPGTLAPPEQKDTETVDGRRLAAIDHLVGKVSDQARTRMQEILAPYPTGELEAMRRHGLKFSISQGKAEQIGAMAGGSSTVALGGYIPVLRRVIFDESVLFSDMGPHMVIHELGHVMDHMRGNASSVMERIPVLRNVRPLMTNPFESENDRATQELYNEFKARANVEDIDVMRREIKLENDMQLPDHYKYVSDDGWGKRAVSYQRKDGVETFHISSSLKSSTPKGLVKAAIGATLLAGSIIVGGPVMATVGGIMLGLGAIGMVRERLHGRTHPTTEVDIAMKTEGAQAHVVQTHESATVTVPEGARSFTGDVWSEYAHRGAGVVEYVAEAYSTYLEGGDKAAMFKETDPKMYAFVEKRLQDEFNSHP